MKALNELELGKKTDTEIAQEARQEQKQQNKEAPRASASAINCTKIVSVPANVSRNASALPPSHRL